MAIRKQRTSGPLRVAAITVLTSDVLASFEPFRDEGGVWRSRYSQVSKKAGELISANLSKSLLNAFAEVEQRLRVRW